jgi:hypothetical protein
MQSEPLVTSAAGHGEPPVATGPSSGTAITSLVLGVAAWTVLPVVGGLLAIGAGRAARREIQERGLPGAGMARTGLMLGYANVLACVAAAIALVLLLRMGFRLLHA